MSASDHDPVGAFFDGIQSVVVRCVIVWILMGIGLGIPLVSRTDWPIIGLAVVFWPVPVVFGIVEWSSLPGLLSIGTILLPVGIFVTAWGFIVGNPGKFSLWLLLSLSMLLTGPALLKSPALGWVVGSWAFGSVAYWGIHYLIARRQERR